MTKVEYTRCEKLMEEAIKKAEQADERIRRFVVKKGGLMEMKNTKSYYKVETIMTFKTTVLVPEDRVSSFDDAEELVNNAVEDVEIHLLEKSPECKTNAIKVVRYTEEQAKDYQIIKGE